MECRGHRIVPLSVGVIDRWDRVWEIWWISEMNLGKRAIEQVSKLVSRWRPPSLKTAKRLWGRSIERQRMPKTVVRRYLKAKNGRLGPDRLVRWHLWDGVDRRESRHFTNQLIALLVKTRCYSDINDSGLWKRAICMPTSPNQTWPIPTISHL